MFSSASQSKIAVIGLSVMGKNLAKNLASRQIQTAVYNRSFEKTQELLDEKNDYLTGFSNLSGLVESLEKPRKIILMVKSGNPVDAVINQLYPLLEEGDIIIDGGNSNWKDTERRQKELMQGSYVLLEDIMSLDENDAQNNLHKKINFVGCGISGGQEGALIGPSIMPGGDKKSVEQVLPLLEQISAKDFKNKPCVINVGLGGSGHFVKMVHNGIEYAIMQFIAELYDIFRNHNLSNLQIKEIFSQINSGNRKGFLLEITEQILSAKDPFNSEKYLLDFVKDKAEAKGTGAWTVENAMQYGVATPSIAAAVFARTLSAKNQSYNIDLEKNVSQNEGKNEDKNQEVDSKNELMAYQNFVNKIEEINQFVSDAFLLIYLQGLDLIFQANKENFWEINLNEVCRIWQGGCIIRSQMLTELSEYFNGNKKLNQDLLKTKDIWKSFIEEITLPTPVISSTWNYYLGIINQNSPMNLIQAQRDFFGAHTYERTDKDGVFSGDWL